MCMEEIRNTYVIVSDYSALGKWIHKLAKSTECSIVKHMRMYMYMYETQLQCNSACINHKKAEFSAGAKTVDSLHYTDLVERCSICLDILLFYLCFRFVIVCQVSLIFNWEDAMDHWSEGHSEALPESTGRRTGIQSRHQFQLIYCLRLLLIPGRGLVCWLPETESRALG